jgi:signal transduction histidine kinase
LVALANQARAQAQAIQIFLSGSSAWLPWLQRLMRAALLLLAVLSTWLTVVVYRRYRRVVTPLRAKLVESDTIIERQEKLAHFGELAAGVAHEIRNPLMAIRARLYTLQRTLAQGTAAHEDATMIRNEIQRLDRIVTDFLKLARPSEPTLAPMTATPLLNEVRDLFAAQCKKQSIQLKLESTVDARFLGDPQQLKQVLINLVRNAIESVEREGTITLHARLDTRRHEKQESEVVVIEVQDTGSGIPIDIQERLFDPFFSTKEGGTGLGLSIVAQIIDKHRGKLEFQTRSGQGTTFGIVFPVCEEAV